MSGNTGQRKTLAQTDLVTFQNEHPLFVFHFLNISRASPRRRERRLNCSLMTRDSVTCARRPASFLPWPAPTVQNVWSVSITLRTYVTAPQTNSTSGTQRTSHNQQHLWHSSPLLASFNLLTSPPAGTDTRWMSYWPCCTVLKFAPSHLIPGQTEWKRHLNTKRETR